MRRQPKPNVDYQRKPALWAGAVTIGLSFAAIFVVERPAWVLPIAFVAGCTAAGAGGFYDAPATNGLVGIVLAAVPLYGLFVLARAPVFDGPITDPDAIFFGASLAMVDVLVYAPFMMTTAYLGGIAGDSVRRRAGGPVGY